MKKYLLNWMTILMVAIVSVGFVSCGDDDDDEKGSTESIVGTWVYFERDGEYSYSEMYTFKSDGTFKLVWQESDISLREFDSGEDSGLWKYDAKNHKLTLTTIIGEEPGPEIYTVILQGNQMTLIDVDGDSYTYTKQ